MNIYCKGRSGIVFQLKNTVLVLLTNVLLYVFLIFPGRILTAFCMRNNSALECAAVVHLGNLVSDTQERHATDHQLYKALRGYTCQKEKM